MPGASSECYLIGCSGDPTPEPVVPTGSPFAAVPAPAFRAAWAWVGVMAVPVWFPVVGPWPLVSLTPMPDALLADPVDGVVAVDVVVPEGGCTAVLAACGAEVVAPPLALVDPADAAEPAELPAPLPAPAPPAPWARPGDAPAIRAASISACFVTMLCSWLGCTTRLMNRKGSVATARRR